MAQRTIFENQLDFRRIVEDDAEGYTPYLWIRDDLDEIEVSLSEKELKEMLPVLIKWSGYEDPRIAETHNAIAFALDRLDCLYQENKDDTTVHEAFNKLAEAFGIERRLPHRY